MSQEKGNKLALFEGQNICKIFHHEEWWFSIIDVIAVLVGGDRPRKYWSDLKKNLAAEGYLEVSDKIGQLKMLAPDGKQRLTDCATTETLFRIIQSIPSPKVEPLKRWLAKVGKERIVKANVEFVGVESAAGTVVLKSGAGNHGDGPPPSKVSIHDMIAEIALKYVISDDDEALYIKEVTEEKTADPLIAQTVLAHRDDGIYLDGAYRGQVNGEIQSAYGARGLYEELSDLKYTDTGGIFDIMAVTVIRHHLPWASA